MNTLAIPLVSTPLSLHLFSPRQPPQAHLLSSLFPFPRSLLHLFAYLFSSSLSSSGADDLDRLLRLYRANPGLGRPFSLPFRHRALGRLLGSQRRPVPSLISLKCLGTKDSLCWTTSSTRTPNPWRSHRRLPVNQSITQGWTDLFIFSLLWATEESKASPKFISKNGYNGKRRRWGK